MSILEEGRSGLLPERGIELGRMPCHRPRPHSDRLSRVFHLHERGYRSIIKSRDIQLLGWLTCAQDAALWPFPRSALSKPMEAARLGARYEVTR